MQFWWQFLAGMWAQAGDGHRTGALTWVCRDLFYSRAQQDPEGWQECEWRRSLCRIHAAELKWRPNN